MTVDVQNFSITASEGVNVTVLAEATKEATSGVGRPS